MKLEFFKYQGTGNDFVMINNMQNQVTLTENQIKFLCDRKLGVGADGVILLEPDAEADFYVNYYNSDGTQSFCGNGSRCSVKFAKESGIISGTHCSFNAIDGFHTGEILQNDEVKVSMRDVNGIEELNGDFILNTGSPHYVQRCNALSELDINVIAHKIRYSERFKTEGINVDFVDQGANEIYMRTYERGVEDETLSCGTGVTAVALALAESNGKQHTWIQTKGGRLGVEFIKDGDQFNSIHLIGEVKKVFQGQIQA